MVAPGAVWGAVPKTEEVAREDPRQAVTGRLAQVHNSISRVSGFLREERDKGREGERRKKGERGERRRERASSCF